MPQHDNAYLWFRDIDAKVRLAEWLDERGEFTGPGEVIYFFSGDKARKWETDYRLMMAEEAGDATVFADPLRRPV